MSLAGRERSSQVAPEHGDALASVCGNCSPTGQTQGGVVLELDVLRVAEPARGHSISTQVLAALTAAADTHR